MADGQIPQWLVQRASLFDGSSASHDIQVGAQIAQQWQQNQRLQRAQALQEEVRRQALFQKEQAANGVVALGRLMEEGGRDNLYTDSEFEGRVWSLGQQFPALLDSPAFHGATRILENAKTAKNKAEITTETQAAISERNWVNMLGRIDLLSRSIEGKKDLTAFSAEINLLRDELKGMRASDLAAQNIAGRSALAAQNIEGRKELQFQKDDAAMERVRAELDKALTILDEKSEDAKELRQLQHDLDVDRDAKKPTTLRPERFDLDESDRMLLNAKLKGLQTWRERNSGKRYDAEYDARMDAIEKEFAGRKKVRSTPAPAPAPAIENSDFKAKYDALPAGAEYIDPNGVKRIKRSSESPAATVPPAAERQVGMIYQTPKGPYRWTGAGWETP